MRVLLVSLVCLWLLQGCELLNKKSRSVADVKSVDEQGEGKKVQSKRTICFVPAQGKNRDEKYHCDFSAWMSFWIKHDGLSWQQRRDIIDKMGDTPDELLKKVLLSQRRGTPYQNRLRAQGWIDQLQSKLTEDSKEWLNVIVHNPSQQLLEFESALTVLTRMNTNQSKEIEAQQDTIKEQQQQIEQLLKIEASMMEKREGINQ